MRKGSFVSSNVYFDARFSSDLLNVRGGKIPLSAKKKCGVAQLYLVYRISLIAYRSGKQLAIPASTDEAGAIS